MSNIIIRKADFCISLRIDDSGQIRYSEVTATGLTQELSMFSYIWPILLIVTANTVYQICAKGIPQAMNTYVSMTVTYAVASVFSFVMFLVTSKGHPNFKDFTLTNWATIILGIVICLAGLYFINK